jgi:hypothetical protein
VISVGDGAPWNHELRWPLAATLLLPSACVIHVDEPELDPGIGPLAQIEGSTGEDLDEGDGTTALDGTGSDGGGPSPFDDTAGDDAELRYLAITPGDVVLELDLDTPASLALTVIGVHADGSSVDLTAEATWSCSNPALGAMNGPALELPAFSDTTIGSTVITAEARGFHGDAQVTVAAYRQTGEHADFFFVLPYSDPAGPQHEPLTFGTDVKTMDVFVSMDTTGSMGAPIVNLQTTLAGTVIPGIQASVPNTQFGVGAIEDFPIPPFGGDPCFVSGAPDQPFELLQSITPVLGAAQAAVDELTTADGEPIGCGADWPEAHIEALYQIATGEGLMGPGQTSVAAHSAGIGGVGFREGSMPVIVLISDAPSHDPSNALCYGGPDYGDHPGVAAVAHTRQEAEDALAEICARVVTVAVNDFDDCSPYSDGLALAESTHALIPPAAWDLAPAGRPPTCGVGECCTGLGGAGVTADADDMCPLVYRSNMDGAGVGAGMVDGVGLLAGYAPFAVTTQVDGVDTDVDGNPVPMGRTTADFILDVVPLGHGAVPLPGVPTPVLTPTGFEGVIPNTDVTFTITAYNHVVPQLAVPQIFEATIRVLADGCSDLDERTVYILVPPEPLPPPG